LPSSSSALQRKGLFPLRRWQHNALHKRRSNLCSRYMFLPSAQARPASASSVKSTHLTCLPLSLTWMLPTDFHPVALQASQSSLKEPCVTFSDETGSASAEELIASSSEQVGSVFFRYLLVLSGGGTATVASSAGVWATAIFSGALLLVVPSASKALLLACEGTRESEVCP